MTYYKKQSWEITVLNIIVDKKYILMISKIKVLCNLLFRRMLRKEKMLLKRDILFLVIFILLTFWVVKFLEIHIE